MEIEPSQELFYAIYHEDTSQFFVNMFIVFSLARLLYIAYRTDYPDYIDYPK